MSIRLLALLLLLSGLLGAAEDKDDPQAGIAKLLGRTGTVRLTTAGKEAGDLSFTVVEGGLSSPWLAKRGFAKVIPFTLKREGGWRLAVDAEQGGRRLIFNANITGTEMEMVKGSFSLVSAKGELETYAFTGTIAKQAAAKR